jgi:hypothetical protein
MSFYWPFSLSTLSTPGVKTVQGIEIIAAYLLEALYTDSLRSASLIWQAV